MIPLCSKNILISEYHAPPTSREDINSVLMTAMQRLLEKNDIDPATIGRLEVSLFSQRKEREVSQGSKQRVFRVFFAVLWVD